MWVTVPVAEEWRADLRLVVQDERLVIAEVRLFPLKPPELPAGVNTGGDSEAGQPWAHGEQWGVHAQAPPGGVTMRLLRRIPLHTYERLAADPLLGIHDDGALLLKELQQPSAPVTKRRGRPPIPDETLLTVASTYAKAFAAGKHPVQSVITRFRHEPMSDARAKDLVYRARRRGFLDKAVWGRAKGRLTPLAETLLKAQRKRRTR